jgi:hypothetical protein
MPGKGKLSNLIFVLYLPKSIYQLTFKSRNTPVKFYLTVLLLIVCSALGNTALAQTAQVNAMPAVLSGSLFKNTNLVPQKNNNYKATDVVGFIYAPNKTNPWVQVPIQVDERDTINCGKIYNTATYVDTEWSIGYNSTSRPTSANYSTFKTLQYCDTNTFTGPDRYPAFDADDELAFMERDLGTVTAPAGTAPPVGVDPASGVEAKNMNVITGKTMYIYLFNRLPNSGLVPSAHKSYITGYNFSFTRKGVAHGLADYKKYYDLFTGPNPESSYITTPYYRRGFADRWIDDTLKIDTGTNNAGINLYSNHTSSLQPGSCGRSEYTFSGEDTLGRPSAACNPLSTPLPQSEGAFVTNIVGPIRAIRSYMGCNSGPLTQRTNIFYDQLEIVHTYLRIHQINGIMDFYNYNPGAGSMVYNNNNNNPATQSGWVSNNGLEGLAIDGVPDAEWKDGPLVWELINSTYGTIFRHITINTNIPVYKPGENYPTVYMHSYYLDDYNAQLQSATDGTKCQCTGDGHAWGSSGTFLTPTPNAPSQAYLFPFTDPRQVVDVYNTSSTETNFYLPPSAPQADTVLWIKAAKYESNPIEYTVSNWPKNYHAAGSIGYINIYPNPSSGIFTLQVFGAADQKITVVFYNAIGRQIYSTTGSGSLQQTVDLSRQSSGVYIAKVFIGDNSTGEKLIVVK